MEAIKKKQDLIHKSFEKKKSELSKNGVLLTDERKAILNLSFAELLQSLKEGHLTATETLQAFQAKALLETEKTNCITELVPGAEKWASERDATPPEKRGLLHGIPISVKEEVDIEEMDTTLGLTKHLGQPRKTNSVLITVLLNQGAVPFVKTNLSQLCYSIGCSNPIYGASKNPIDTSRSPGGSSGGEGALIRGGGSILGIGSDLGGSIRIPSNFCGLFGIKPTARRLSRGGCSAMMKDTIGISNTIGFLSREVDALAAAMEAALQDGYMSSLDPLIPDLPWNKHLFETHRPLKIGWFEQDDFFPVAPGIKRAIKIAKETLEKRGHELVPFSPPNMEEMYDILTEFLSANGGRIMLRQLEGEVIDDSISLFKKLTSAPWFYKLFMKNYTSLSSPLLAKLASQHSTTSANLGDTFERRTMYRDDFISSWKAEKLDVLLGPSFPIPAIHPSQNGNLLPCIIYTIMQNIFDFPAGAVPVTIENEEDQRKLDEYPTNDFVFECIKKTTTGAIGLPLSIQVTGLPWKEEVVMYAMKEIHLGLEDNKKCLKE